MSADPGSAVETYKRVGPLQLRAHLHFPPGGRSGDDRVGVVLFHGGGFVGGAPAQFSGQCARLAGQGHVAMTVGYRLCGSTASRVAELVADARSAVRWVRANAARLGIDPNRVVAGGGSAGGHLAACTALVDGFDDVADDLDVSCVPDALALFNPVLDVPATAAEGRVALVRELFGADQQALSPTHLVRPKLPPTILFQGTEDVLTRVEHARRFQEAMVACGNSVRLHEYSGRGHGFFNVGVDDDTWFDDTMGHLEGFISTLWPVRSPPGDLRAGAGPRSLTT